MQDILEKMALKKPVIFLGESLAEQELILPEQNADYPDPHIWFDVSLWQKALKAITIRLDSLEVLNSARSSQYLSDLESLHRFTRKEISKIPESRRVLLTAHDAFSYFGRAYDIEVIGLQGISTVSEYGLKDVEEMVDLISSRNIAAVFVESSISSRSMEAVVSGVKQKGGDVKIGGTLYSDAPGPAGSGAETYTEMVRHNVETIKSALE
jgi:manganese/zinc/iron transport system substrate-binding protein